MSPDTLTFRDGNRTSPLLQMRLWHLGILEVLTAIAIADIQNHGRREPVLVLLASVGYAAFGLICWLCWNAVNRFERRVGSVLVVAVYTLAMGGLFLAATVAYLLIEYVYLGGKLL
jgi:hypothetical protein